MKSDVKKNQRYNCRTLHNYSFFFEFGAWYLSVKRPIVLKELKRIANIAYQMTIDYVHHPTIYYLILKYLFDKIIVHNTNFRFYMNILRFCKSMFSKFKMFEEANSLN